MKRFFLILSVLALTGLGVMAQHSIQSNVFNRRNGLALEFSTVRLLNAKDSSFVQGARTNESGTFIISKVKSGSYIIAISSVGYKNYYQTVTVDKKDLILKNIQMSENVHALEQVEVTGAAAQLVVKGDTTEYNATAFKTAQGAVLEELLKKMPGVEISSDGKITVNGQEIKKIRVDGKKFFDGDAEMATKNIPAEMIDKIQVYDNKSDMAKLTGFEDNDTERIINLTTKSNRKHGVFGNVTGGAGADIDKNLRYDGNGFINIMDGEAQTAITGGGNNTNTTRSSRGRSGMGNPSGGITATQNLGINTNTTVNPQLKIGGDASLNHSENESSTVTNKLSYLKGDTLTNTSKSNSMTENYSANMRLEVEWKPDTLNTFVLQPTIGYNRSFSGGDNAYNYLTNGVQSSVGNSWNRSNSSSLDANLNLIYNHKFTSKRGRTLTANLQTGISQSNSESWSISNKQSIGVDTTANNLYTTNLSNKFNINLRISYVEPLWNVRNLLETAVSLRTNNNVSDKNQYNKDLNVPGATNDINVRDTLYTPASDYSSNFKSNFFSETMEMNYRYVSKDYNLMLGMKAEPSQTYSTRIYDNGNTTPYTNEVVNLAPTGRFQYNFEKKKFVRIDYRGQSNQPSISQMQPVKNNSNLMNVAVGNPTLNPEFNHNFRMFYSSFNEITFSSFNAMINAQATKDALVTNSIYDVTGKQYNQAVNADVIPYSFFANIMYNTPIIPKRLQFNTNTSINYDQRYGYSKKGLNNINTDTVASLPLGDLSDTRKYSASEALSLTFTTDVLEIGARGSLRYSNTKNNMNTAVSETYDWTAAGNIVLHLPYDINIATDLNYTTLQGYSTFDNKQLIWNAGIDKSLFNNKGVISLKMFDILHQQLNIRQTIGDNYIQYSNSLKVLRSYFLLSFSYKINEFKGNKNQDRRPDFERFGRGGGDHYHRGDRGGMGGGGGYGGGGHQF